jgi:hypothetical protein
LLVCATSSEGRRWSPKRLLTRPDNGAGQSGDGRLSSTIPPVARLANDIARQFEYLPLESAARQVAAHLTSWDPHMRAELLDVPDESLDPVAAAAREVLRGVRS